MHEYTDEILNSHYNRSLEIVEIGETTTTTIIVLGVKYTIRQVNEWRFLGNVEEYSINDDQNSLLQSCSLTLSGEETINIADYYQANFLIRIRSRLGSDLHPGSLRTLGVFFIDSIEIDNDKNITIQGRSTLKLATLRPYVGSHKRSKSWLNPSINPYVNSPYWKLRKYDPGAAYPYYIFVLANPYINPNDLYITLYGDLDYIKNWCESPNFPIYIAPSNGTPTEADRVYPGDNFEILYALGQIRCNKAWWDDQHTNDSFWVKTTYELGSLNWYKGEMQAEPYDYSDQVFIYDWHDTVYATNVIKTILEDAHFQSVDPDALFYINQLSHTYLLTNCEKIFYYDAQQEQYIDYTDSNVIPMPQQNDHLYIGLTERFKQLYVYINDIDSALPYRYNIQWQYYNIDSVWIDMPEFDNSTNKYHQDGIIRFVYYGLGEQVFTTINGVRAYWIRGIWHKDNIPNVSIPGKFSNISIAWDADIPDLKLTARDRVTHLEAINTYVLPYLPPNYKIRNQPEGNIESYLVLEKRKPDFSLTTIENVSIEKNDSNTYTSVLYYGRARFVPNRLSLKDRDSNDIFEFSSIHQYFISSGNWNNAFDDNLKTDNGVEFTFPSMGYCPSWHFSVFFAKPIHLGENARFSMIGKGGLGRWSVYVIDAISGRMLSLNNEACDFPVDVDELRNLEAPFNAEYISSLHVWLWHYNPTSRRVGYREIGLWGTDLLIGRAVLGSTPPFDTEADKKLMEQLYERVWQNEEIDERANTQTIVNYRARQYLSYFLRNIQNIQVSGVRPDIKLYDTVHVTLPDLNINDTFLVEAITRSPNSVVSAKLVSYRTDIL